MKHGSSSRKDHPSSITTLVFLVLMVAALICGCSDDPESPAPPNLSLSIGCEGGTPVIQVANDGGKMSDQSICRLQYEDGAFDSLLLQLDAGQILICHLSNIHGGVTAEIMGTSLSGSVGDCLSPAFQEMLETFGGTIDLTGLIPTPLVEQNILMCHYTFYLENVAYESPVYSVTRIDGGMTIQVVYHNITGDIRAETSDFLCTDFTGDMTIDSIVYSADVIIDEGSATLFNGNVVINDLDIQIDGVLGFLVGWLVDFFASDFASGFEEIFEEGFQAVLEPLLTAILNGETSCE